MPDRVLCTQAEMHAMIDSGSERCFCARWGVRVAVVAAYNGVFRVIAWRRGTGYPGHSGMSLPTAGTDPVAPDRFTVKRRYRGGYRIYEPAVSSEEFARKISLIGQYPNNIGDVPDN